MLAYSTARFHRACLMLASMSLMACSLIGVEPDEIDFAVDATGEDTGAEGQNTSESGGAETGMTTSATATGDGDGDGDGDPGDGDGDPTTSSSDGGDGDGDGDGDPADMVPCASLSPAQLMLGDNPIMIGAGASLASGACGYDGPEAMLEYTNTSDTNVVVALTLSGFDAALYSVDGDICLPLVEIDCVTTPETLIADVAAGQTVYFVVDAMTVDGGSGVLNLALQ